MRGHSHFATGWLGTYSQQKRQDSKYLVAFEKVSGTSDDEDVATIHATYIIWEPMQDSSYAFCVLVPFATVYLFWFDLVRV